jgi:hypothetical protein
VSHYTNKRIRRFASLHWERATIRSTIAGLDTIVFHTERAAPDTVDIEFEQALRIVLTRLESRFKELTHEILELGLNDDGSE